MMLQRTCVRGNSSVDTATESLVTDYRPELFTAAGLSEADRIIEDEMPRRQLHFGVKIFNCP